MAAQHPVYVQRLRAGKKNKPTDKVIVVTVVDAETLGLDDNDEELFFLAQTAVSVYTRMNPTITLERTSKFQSLEYTEGVSKKTGEHVTPTRGQGINYILRGPYWFLKKVQTIQEMLG